MTPIDVNLSFRTALITALNGNLSLGTGSAAINVPVFDRVPRNQDYPFVVIQTADINDDKRSKDNYLWTITATVNVVMAYPGDYGGQADVDGISTQILSILGNTDATYLTLESGLEMLTLKFNSLQPIESQTETHYVVQKSIVIQSIINQSI